MRFSRLAPPALALALSAAAPAARAEGLFPGFAVGVEYTETGLARAYTGTGASWAKTRLEAFSWGAVEPAPPRADGTHAYDFRCTDALVGEHQEAGITRVVSYVSPKSSWGSVSFFDIMPRPERLADYAAFVRALVERYDGDGVDDMPGLVAAVRFWVVGGEWTGFWPSGNADDYLALLAATRDAARAAHPRTLLGLIPFLLFDVFEGDPSPQEIAERLKDPPPAWRQSTAGMLKIIARTDLYDFLDVHSLGDYTEIPPTLAWLRARLAERGVFREILIDDATPIGYLAMYRPSPNVGWPPIFPVTEAQYPVIHQHLLDVAAFASPGAKRWIEAETAAGSVKKVVTAAAEGASGILMGNTEDWMPDTNVGVRQLAVNLIGAAAMMGIREVAHPAGTKLCDRRAPGAPRPAWHALRLVVPAMEGAQRCERLAGLLAGVHAVRFARGAESVVVAWYEDRVLQLPGEEESPFEVEIELPGAAGAAVIRPPYEGGAAPTITSAATVDGKARVALTSAPVLVVPLTTAELFVPVVLAAHGMNGSYFTSELTLANRGLTPAAVELTYTAAFGGGSGTVADVLAAGEQRTVADAIAYLVARGLPAAGGDRGGTLRVRFGGLSSASAVSATVRTTTALPLGRAGLAYAGARPDELLAGSALLWGLRQDARDRTNVAAANAGRTGNVTLRVTLFPGGVRLSDVTLAPGELKQWSGLLAEAGLSSGWARIERVSGSVPWIAYAVVNDQITSDGSYVPAIPEEASAPALLAIPAAVETGAYVTELVLGNASPAAKRLRLTLVSGAIPSGSAFAAVTLASGEQRLVPSAVELLREAGGIGPPGAAIAGALFVEPESGGLEGVFAGARTSTRGGGGSYGVFYPAAPGFAAHEALWLHGLAQDAEERTNLALVELSGEGGTFRVEVHDASGLRAGAVDVMLGAREWRQMDGVLARLAPGVPAGSARVTRVAGGGRFTAYAVVNDGARPGERTGDGAFIAPSR